MKTVSKYLLATSLSITTILVASLLACNSCTPLEQQQAVAAITPAGACVAQLVAITTGTEDPLEIATNCGTTLADIYQIVKELLNTSKVVPDAGAVAAPQPMLSIPVMDASVPAPVAITVEHHAHLSRILARTKALMEAADAALSITDR
jgi:hypothetical protein